MDCHRLLDVFIVLAELLVVEPKLIHKVGSHLLDLVIGEGLKCVCVCVGWGIIMIIKNIFARGTGAMCCCFRVSHLLERQVIGEGALHVVILTGGVHVVGADLWVVYDS